MAMSRKDFVAIAAVIKSEVDTARLLQNEQAIATLTIVANNLAHHCATACKEFNRNRFLDACGV